MVTRCKVLTDLEKVMEFIVEIFKVLKNLKNYHRYAVSML